MGTFYAFLLVVICVPLVLFAYRRKVSVASSLVVFIIAGGTMGGCAARQNVPVIEIPKIETVSCTTESEEMTVFANSPEEAESQVELIGWQVIETNQATLEPNGVRDGVWVVSATHRVCRSAS